MLALPHGLTCIHNRPRRADMIKKILWITVFTAGISTAIAADVGVSISVGQPGFYGQIDIGNFPQPRVVSNTRSSSRARRRSSR